MATDAPTSPSPRIGGVEVRSIGAQGPQLGLPQMIQSRPQFGYVGALLVLRPDRDRARTGTAGTALIDESGWVAGPT